MVLRVQGLQPLTRDVRVDRGGGNIRMTQKQLDRTQIRPMVEQVCGKGMPKRVR